MKRLWFTLCLSCACADSPPASEHADHFDVDAADADFKGCPENIPAFALGIEAVGKAGNLRAHLLSAMPAPPLRYLNDWTISLTDASGAPLDDVRVTKARPFMPVHGHDGNLTPRVSALAAPGEFAIRGLNLNMRGPWEVQLSASSERAGDDELVFLICVSE